MLEVISLLLGKTNMCTRRKTLLPDENKTLSHEYSTEIRPDENKKKGTYQQRAKSDFAAADKT